MSLISAVKHNDSNEVSRLLQSGANVNENDKFGGVTALHYACEKGFYEIAEELIEHGANVNAITQAQWTPMHFAAREGHLAIVKLLVKKGASPKGKDNTGRTPVERTIHENVIAYFEGIGVKQTLQFDDD